MRNNLSLFSSIVSSLGGFLFGYGTAVIAGAMLFIQRTFQFSDFAIGWIVSILLIGALLGSLIGGPLADRWGRKKSLFFSLFCFIGGTILLVFAENFEVLLIGRFVVGIAVGLFSFLAPLYIAEIAPSQHRGVYVSLNQLAITLGVLAAYVMSFVYARNGAWKEMFAMGFIPSGLMFFGLFFIPETPSFLALKDKKKALLVLKKPQEHLFHKSLLPALFIGIGLSVFQQITGINVVIYYAPKIFQMVHMDSLEMAVLATIGVGMINVLFAIVSLFLIDRLGRKLLLLIGIGGMAVCLFGIGFSLQDGLKSDFIAMGSIFLYVGFFALALGPIVWLVLAEIFPIELRGRSMGIAAFFNWGFNFIVSLTFLSLVHSIGKSGSFFLYGIITLLAFWFVLRFLPETMGKSLEEIQKFFEK